MIMLGKKFIWLGIHLAFLFGASFAMPAKAESHGASLYLAPNSGTFTVGSTFDVSIFTNTGGKNVNAIEANLKFDPQKLQIASPTSGKSFISIWIAPPSFSNSAGTLVFKGGVPTPGINTSAGLVSTITFRAIAPGETTISFLDTSKILLDDGNGTDILNSLEKGTYAISIPPPEGPKVFSSTHHDLNKWLKDGNPTFSWEKADGVTDFSYGLDSDSKDVPDNVSEGGGASISYSDLADGIWYLHIKAKKGDIWGGTTHYAIQIDRSAPAAFTPEISPGAGTSNSEPIIIFSTTDSLSGLDHFEIKTIDITPDRKNKDDSFFIEATSPYRLPPLKIGKYMAAVRAFDKAGNWRDEAVNLEIVPKGFKASKGGVWVNGIFLPWPLILGAIFILIVLIVLFLLYSQKKARNRDVEIIRKARSREKELMDNIGKYDSTR